MHKAGQLEPFPSSLRPTKAMTHETSLPHPHPLRSRAVAAIGPLLALTGTLFASTAAHSEPQSVYTNIDKSCRTVSDRGGAQNEPETVRQICGGKGGFVVVVSEDDLRQTVSIGRSARQAEREPAAKQSFGPFNSSGPTLEWRIGDNGRPYATIQRWHIADNSDPGPDGRPRTVPLLVVTRLSPACHVAYVDARANQLPNELARDLADRLAPGFDCAKDKIATEGTKGRALQLAQP